MKLFSLLLVLGTVGCGSSPLKSDEPIWIELHRNLIRTTHFVPPANGCFIIEDGWYAERTQKGNDGVFYWNCEEPEGRASLAMRSPMK